MNKSLNACQDLILQLINKGDRSINATVNRSNNTVTIKLQSEIAEEVLSSLLSDSLEKEGEINFTLANDDEKTTLNRGEQNTQPKRKHNHYFKDVSRFNVVDIYRVLSLYEVKDQCLGHAIKKLLVAGGRGAGKDTNRDINEVIDTLQRRQEMQEEDGDIK